MYKNSPFFHYNFIVRSYIREKLYKSILLSRKDSFLRSIDLKSIDLFFTFTNSSEYYIIFLSMLILLERLSFSPFRFILSKKDYSPFRLKSQMKMGAYFSMTNFFKDRFLKYFFPLSLLKNKHLRGCVILDDSVIYHFHNSFIQWGIQKLLFDLSITYYDLDYNLFFYFFKQLLYGFNIRFQTSFRNYYLNRMLCSGFGYLIL